VHKCTETADSKHPVATSCQLTDLLFDIVVCVHKCALRLERPRDWQTLSIGSPVWYASRMVRQRRIDGLYVQSLLCLNGKHCFLLQATRGCRFQGPRCLCAASGSALQHWCSLSMMSASDLRYIQDHRISEQINREHMWARLVLSTRFHTEPHDGKDSASVD
jgi:hypothetical protein